MRKFGAKLLEVLRKGDMVLLALCVLVSYFNVDALLLTFIAKALKGTLGCGYYLAAPALLGVAVIQLRHQGRPVILRTTCTLLVPLLAEKLEKDGRGLNLTWEVRNGIVTHTKGTWAATPEGRIVRMADQIAYVNHDIEDAVRAGVLDPATLPKDCTAVLGQTKSARITTMINSILAHSDGDVAVGAEENEAFLALRDFMYATVYVDKNHPLAGRGEVTEEELAPYPCVTFEQGTHNAVFFSEDISMPAVTPRHILVRDRATANDLTREINAYQPGIGLDDEVSRTVYQSSMLYLKPRKQVSLGYIVRNHMLRSPMAQAYIQAMEDYAEKYKRSHGV